VHVMKKALEKGGFKTAIAGDGREGVRLAKDLKPDLIFMDIVMPGMNGYQATRAISQDPGTRSIPIVMVTSKGLETDRVWGLRQGAVDYRVKPSRRSCWYRKPRQRWLPEARSQWTLPSPSAACARNPTTCWSRSTVAARPPAASRPRIPMAHVSGSAWPGAWPARVTSWRAKKRAKCCR